MEFVIYKIMSSPENSPRLWDKLWMRMPSRFPLSDTVESLYRRSIYFSAFDTLLKSFTLANQDILELGSGTGQNSLYLAQRHTTQSVTLVDFSEQALVRVQTQRFPCELKKIHQDLFAFRPIQRYDFVHSAGLIEHFAGHKRIEVVKIHAQCIRKGGLAMIWVPVNCLAFEFIGRFNRLIGIEEIPFAEKELEDMCIQSGLKILQKNHTAFGALYGLLTQKISS